MSGHWFGWDIGGAHLKVAMLDAAGELVAVRQLACPLWRGIDELRASYAALDLPLAAPAARHAVTMTGELCDCFVDRGQGVRAIAATIAAQLGPRAEIGLFAGPGRWLDPAQLEPSAAAAVASANWLALASWCAQARPAGLLIDIGSTTTDVVPFARGRVLNRGVSDAERMALEELVYTGIVRSPVNTVCHRAPWDGQRVRLAAEYFATMADVYRVLGILDERHDLMPGADGQAKDPAGSARRLARMLGRDYAPADWNRIVDFAQALAAAQRRLIEDAMVLVQSRGDGGSDALVGAGAGRFIARDIAAARGLAYEDIADLFGLGAALGDAAAVAAPAVAVAKLAWRAA